MPWYDYLSFGLGGVLLTNAVPHVVSGIMGRPFQSPFAEPPGQGLSSSTVNVLWGAFNAAVGYVLVLQVGAFDVHDLRHVAAAALPAFALALFSARHFGRYNGGDLAPRAEPPHSKGA